MVKPFNGNFATQPSRPDGRRRFANSAIRRSSRNLARGGEPSLGCGPKADVRLCAHCRHPTVNAGSPKADTPSANILAFGLIGMAKRYFFDLLYSRCVRPDGDGILLSDPGAAKRYGT